MAVIATRRSVMTLFSGPTCLYSHRVRMVLAEKGINVEVVNVDAAALPEDLLDLNPYHTVPTLVDRELVLYDAHVITEYLDERFPHPPLMPVDPVMRAQFRLALFRIERDWYSLVDQLEAAGADSRRLVSVRRQLKEGILSSSEIFAATPYFLSEEFSLVDCSLAPLLWRLPQYGIDLPSDQAAPIMDYMDRVFDRPGFKTALTELETEMREAAL